jgi:hypothetical protein
MIFFIRFFSMGAFPKALLGLGLFLGLWLSSCDILRTSPFEVEAWSPGEGFHSPPEELSLSLLFSRDPDRVSVERSFSLSEDGTGRRGAFSWEGRRLFFHPAFPLERDRDYRISLSTGAEDREGLSLEKSFEASFHTREEGRRPGVLSVSPPYDGLLEGRGEIELRFSLPVTLESCVDHISLSPPVSGAWRLEEGGRAAIFSPAEPWKKGGPSGIKVSAAFTGANRLPLEGEFSSRFRTRTEEEPPFLLSLRGIRPNGEELPLIPFDPERPGEENRLWERDMKLRLEFSEPVGAGGLGNRLSAEGGPRLILETREDFSSGADFSFAEKPAPGSRFLLRLSKGVADREGNGSLREELFPVFVGGPHTRPPALAGMRLPLTAETGGPGETAVYSPEQPFETLPLDHGEFPYGQNSPFWVELYFHTAPGAAVDPFSVMDKFRVETSNNALSFSPRSVHTGGFSREEPVPGWEGLCRIELRGSLVHGTNSGVVSFRIGAGLSDSGGNRNEEEFRIPLLK